MVILLERTLLEYKELPCRHPVCSDPAAELGAAIDALPENERLAVTLRYYEELYPVEIGEILGLTEPGVSKLMGQVMFRLPTNSKPHFNNYDKTADKV